MRPLAVDDLIWIRLLGGVLPRQRRIFVGKVVAHLPSGTLRISRWVWTSARWTKPVPLSYLEVKGHLWGTDRVWFAVVERDGRVMAQLPGPTHRARVAQIVRAEAV